MEKQEYPRAKLSVLIESLDMHYPESRVYFDRHTAEIILLEESFLNAAEEDDEDRFKGKPEWQQKEAAIARAIVEDKNDRFIDPPDKFDFHEYRHMQDFIRSLGNIRAADELASVIRGQGAFGRFENSLHRLDLLDDWFKYREEVMKEFVIEWAEENKVAYVDDLEQKKAMRDRREQRE